MESPGFEYNPYDPCVANKIMNEKQLTATIHVDHVKSSHDYPRINDDFIQFVYCKYRDLEILEIK